MTPVALWVVPVSELAGVARHVLDAARTGIPGYKLQLTAPAGPLLDAARTLGVPTHPAGLGGHPAKALRDLRNVITAVQPAVVHTHLAKADFLGSVAAAGRAPLVSTEHGIAADSRIYHRSGSKAALRRAMHRARIRRFDALIAVSESTRREMVKAWKPKVPIDVILNGVDPVEALRTTGHRYLSLSRLAPEKRIDAVLRSFATVARAHPQASLTVAGEGPLREELDRLATELGIAGQVGFPGHVDPEQALSTHDVLVQLSAWENASYSILDAVNHGLGVAATPVGGNPEILPEHCLADVNQPTRLVDILTKQASDLLARPGLPEGWPTVAQMTAQVAAVYEKVRA